MEKRLILAATLSFLVLYFWSLLNPPQKSKPGYHHILKHDAIETKESSSLSNSKIVKSSKLSSNNRINENITTIETKQFIAKFSNIGGVLKDIFIKNYNVRLPITQINELIPYDTVLFLLKKITKNTIVYEYKNNNIKIIKQYILNNNYIINSNINIYYKNKSRNNNILKINTYSLDMTKIKKSSLSARNRSLLEYVIYSDKGMFRKNNAYKFSKKEERYITGHVIWTGFRDKYYCAIIKPKYETSGYIIHVKNSEHANIIVIPKNIKNKENFNFVSLIYIGPESWDILKQIDPDFTKIKRYYKWGLFDIMGKIVNRIIHALHKFIPNWGICIIIMSILVYSITYPITLKNMISMRKMQALQPQMAALKEKYKNNPQKLNIEIMELYKRNNVNPMAGCLPMFLQMPIFLGLLQALWRDVAFKDASFLWIKDLTAPDRLFILPINLPFIGNEINILPIIIMFLMFFQQRLSSANMANMDPEQEAQQKMMRILMPIFFGAIFYKFASGLTLYWTTNNLLSCFTQWKLARIKNK